MNEIDIELLGKDKINLLVLYNPYYEKKVIEKHLEILNENNIVAFGKVKSKLKKIENSNEEKLEAIYKTASKESPLQLFITDYSNMFVANVIKVKKTTEIKNQNIMMN